MAQLESQPKLFSCVVVVAVVHVVAAPVVADVDAPGFWKHFKLETFPLVVFEPFEEPFIKKVELELNFDNVLGQEVCCEFSVVGSRVLASLEVSEQICEEFLCLLSEGVTLDFGGQIAFVETLGGLADLLLQMRILLRFNVSQLSVLHQHRAHMIHNWSEPLAV